MLMLSASAQNLVLTDAGIIAALGYGVVFLGLVLLMSVTILLGKIFTASAKKKTQTAQIPTPVSAPPAPTATGSAGQLKLYNVEPKTAAMLMAIVADKMGKPLNELRFISIKEVE